MRSATVPATYNPEHASLYYEHAGIIDRLRKKEGLAEQEAERLFRDLIRFLYLCGTSDQAYVPSKRIDLAWHHFILFTRDYKRFCETFFGRFIHHDPEPPEADSTQLFQSTLDAARVFAPLSANWDESCYCKTNNCKGGDCRELPKPDDLRLSKV
jgi:hypothetical protein